MTMGGTGGGRGRKEKTFLPSSAQKEMVNGGRKEGRKRFKNGKISGVGSY